MTFSSLSKLEINLLGSHHLKLSKVVASCIIMSIIKKGYVAWLAVIKFKECVFKAVIALCISVVLKPSLLILLQLMTSFWCLTF